MDNEQIKANLEDLASTLGESLEDYGFRAPPSQWKNEEVVKIEWSRDAGWKKDIVEISFPYQPLKVSGYVLVQMLVRVPTGHGKEDMLDGTPVRTFLGNPTSSYNFPGLSTSLLPSRFKNMIRRVIDETLSALCWFDLYDDPAKCLARLNSGETVVGPVKSAGVARRVFDYLSRLNDSTGAQ